MPENMIGKKDPRTALNCPGIFSLRRINIFKIRRSFSYPSPDFQLTLSQFHAILNYSKATKQKRSGCSRIAFNTNYPPQVLATPVSG